MENSNKKKILVIDDDENLTNVLVDKLNLSGFETLGALDGGEGLKKALTFHPDVILLDVVMPRKDGFEVLKNLRADKDFSKTKIILLTNLGQKSDVDKGLRLGADAYIIKAHYTPTEVVSRVLEIISNRK